MNRKLGLLVCNFLVPEIAHVIKNGDFPQIILKSYPARCIKDPFENQSILENKFTNEGPDLSVMLLAGNCMNANKTITIDDKQVRTVYLKQYFEIFIDSFVIDQYTKNGYYIVSNGWLRMLHKNLASWGFDKDSARSFFGESLHKILFLDTMIPGDYLPALNELSDYMGLAYEILPVGLTHCENFIKLLISDWKLEIAQLSCTEKIAEISRQTADYAFVFNQLDILVSLTSEDEIINSVFDMLNVLYAPEKITYQKFANGQETPQLYSFQNSDKTTDENETPFEIKVSNSQELLGEFAIYGIRFPKYIERYKQTGVLIGGFCSLSIANARKFELIQKQKQELHESAEELRKINQSKDLLYSVIAHDLRSPFNGILGFSGLLVSNPEDYTDDESKQMLGMIHSQAASTLNLLENLLLWTSSQTGKVYFSPSEFEISSLIQEEISNLNTIALSKNIELQYPDPVELKINADQNMLKTVLRNLITNSIKFTHPGGRIIVCSYSENDSLKISISDNGIGMSQELAENLFSGERNKTRQGTSNEKGSGIGLLLCKEFIERHSGKIWAESQEGVGSTFIIKIPFR